MAEIRDQYAAIVKIFGIIILKEDGQRIYSQYFPELHAEQATTFRITEEQKKFEQQLVEKCRSLPSVVEYNEIFTLHMFTVLVRSCGDCYLIIVGDSGENELLLDAALDTLYDCLLHITTGKLQKRTLLERYEQLILVIDELVEQGQGQFTQEYQDRPIVRSYWIECIWEELAAKKLSSKALLCLARFFPGQKTNLRDLIQHEMNDVVSNSYQSLHNENVRQINTIKSSSA